MSGPNPSRADLAGWTVGYFKFELTCGSVVRTVIRNSASDLLSEMQAVDRHDETFRICAVLELTYDQLVDLASAESMQHDEPLISGN
ncbi:hypothetical protein [Chelatococcus reniformis]|uniref:Uncharacterized protein n=1 Tax=Chelatococcus reniformis TaxID=1494448 RepID=A0A916XPJ5_9HYPH|nr:hypothetical protein [Chelatococcus reniformis]GGC93194.1 hypothetical protein GCM10010994_58760 [Chelatococcus reniformis]